MSSPPDLHLEASGSGAPASPTSEASSHDQNLNAHPPAPQRHHVRYAEGHGTDVNDYGGSANDHHRPPPSPHLDIPPSPSSGPGGPSPGSPVVNRPSRSDTIWTTDSRAPIRRRTTRVNSFRPVQDYDDFEVRPGWQPGSEPGLDPAKPDGGHASMPTLTAPCEITVVDFSHHQLSMRRFDNDSLVAFLREPQPAWSRCRWINVKGLSWDVIQALGQHKKLHNLAIEDLLNTRNRTKTDWFPTHAFIVLTLQKLVHLSRSDDDSESDDDDDWSSRRSQSSQHAPRLRKRLSRWFGSLFSSSGKRKSTGGRVEEGTYPMARVGGEGPTTPQGPALFRTIQEYHASPNDARTEFMEKHSALAERGLAVAAEQVALFLTDDNTVISFFELSAEDVEKPIVRRLQTADTILRQSCDASMIGQAIVDAIIDLAIPVTACYSDVIGDLELDVLTHPSIRHTKSLYVLLTEIDKMLSFVHPITNLINALRDHKTDLSQEAAARVLQSPAAGVLITPTTYTYLGDVLDHCVLITESLNRSRRSADGLIGLIFNTISASQNESMQQLTVVSIIFLPLTFLTGYFGQNFEPFDELQRGISFFWMIAAPVMVATILVLMRLTIWEYITVLVTRRHIGRLRSKSKKHRKKQ